MLEGSRVISWANEKARFFVGIPTIGHLMDRSRSFQRAYITSHFHVSSDFKP